MTDNAEDEQVFVSYKTEDYRAALNASFLVAASRVFRLRRDIAGSDA